MNPRRRSKRLRTGAPKLIKRVSFLPGTSNYLYPTQPPNAPTLYLPHNIPAGAAGQYYSNQARQEIKDIRSKLADVELEQRRLRHQLAMVERTLLMAQDPNIAASVQRNGQDPQKVKIRILLHRILTSSEPPTIQDHTALLTFGRRSRKQKLTKFCNAIVAEFSPVIKESNGLPLSLKQGRIELKKAGKKAGEEPVEINLEYKDSNQETIKYKKWYKDNLTNGSEEVVDVEVWAIVDAESDTKKEESGGANDDITMKVEEAS